MKQQWSSKWVTWSIWEVSDKRENEQSHKVRGKTEKYFKNCPHFAKHGFFAAEVSHQIHPPKHFKPKVLKNFLSVFRDWKSYSRGSHKLSCENLCVPLRLDLPLMNKSPKLTRELTTMACDLTYPRLSRQNKATLFFEIFRF